MFLQLLLQLSCSMAKFLAQANRAGEIGEGAFRAEGFALIFLCGVDCRPAEAKVAGQEKMGSFFSEELVWRRGEYTGV